LIFTKVLFFTKTEDIEIGKFKEHLEIDQAFVLEGSEDLMRKSNQIGKFGLAERAQALSDINLITANMPEKFEARVFHALYIHTLKTENEEKEKEKKENETKKTFRKRSSIGSYRSTAASI